jgi:hypothetical protein
MRAFGSSANDSSNKLDYKSHKHTPNPHRLDVDGSFRLTVLDSGSVKV